MDKQYARIPIEFNLDGQSQKMESLVSEFGIRRVFEVKNVPENRNLTGERVYVNMSGLSIVGIFTKEILPETSFYNIRFHTLSREVQDMLRANIAAHGFRSPWSRVFPRISTDFNDEAISMPKVALVDNSEGMHFFKILNFTLGGVLLEGAEEKLKSFSMGARFYFQIVTSDNQTISGIWGKIVRVDEDFAQDVIIKRYGVQIVSMSPKANKRYKDIIFAYCKKVKAMHVEGQ